MPLISQARLLRAMQEIVMGDASNALPAYAGPKPNLVPYTGTLLPRSTPEAEGLSSELLESYYRDISTAPDANCHGLLVIRHGKVVSEGYFAPYRQDVWHVTHSLCKSFTGTAVALAIQEGLFSLDDYIVKYFSDKIGLFSSKKFKSIQVKHLLTMSSGISFNEVDEIVSLDWLKDLFASDIAFAPGSKFVYNSMNSYLLAALVCRTSKQSLVQYLTSRLFEPLGFGPVGWELSPEGIEKGGWGMYIALEDMAKLGQLYLQKGEWILPSGQTKQIISPEWVQQATHTQIQGDGPFEEYGYQIWTQTDTSHFIFNGMFGQYVMVMPEKELIIAMTAGNPKMFIDSIANNITQKYFKNIALPDTLPPQPAALASLRNTTAHLIYRKPAITITPKRERKPATLQQRWRTGLAISKHSYHSEGLDNFCGKTWVFSTNKTSLLPVITQAMNSNMSSGLKALHINHKEDHLELLWEQDETTYSIPLGIGYFKYSNIKIGRETFLLAGTAEMRTNEDDKNVLKIELCPIETSSCRLIKLMPQGDNLLVSMDEIPQLSVALETIISQSTTTSASPSTKENTSPYEKLLQRGSYIHHKVMDLCTPTALGIPEKSMHNTSSIQST